MKLIFLLLLIISCSTQKVTSDIETVSFQDNDQEKLKIKEQTIQDITNDNEAEKKEERVPEISLSIYSSLYSSLGFLNLFTEIEKENIEINQITANGLAAVIAAVYAQDKSVNTLEWKLFKLLKSLKGITPYTSKWRERVEDFCKEEFKNKKLQDLKLAVIIPVYEQGILSIAKEGSIVDVLINNLQIESDKNYFKKPSIFKRDLVNQVSDLNFNATFLPEEMKFKLIDGYSWGIFTNYFGFLLKNSNDIYAMKTSTNLALDELLPLSDFKAAYAESAKIFVEKMSLEISNWKEEITASSN